LSYRRRYARYIIHCRTLPTVHDGKELTCDGYKDIPGAGASQHRTLTVAPSNIACNSLIVCLRVRAKPKTRESLAGMSLHPSTERHLDLRRRRSKIHYIILTMFCRSRCAFSSSHDQSKPGFRQGTLWLCHHDNLKVCRLGRGQTQRYELHMRVFNAQ
jgi:hypothetical protein